MDLKNTRCLCILKLKHDIKDESEVKLAKLEAEGLLGTTIKGVRNLIDLLVKEPLSFFIEENGVRFQDYFTRLPFLGSVQAFFTNFEEMIDPSELVKRLAYFKEVYLVYRGKPMDVFEKIEVLKPFRKPLEPHISGPRVEVFDIAPFGQLFSVKDTDVYVLRLICFSYILESAYYVAKLFGRELLEEGLERLFEYLKWGVGRNPILGGKNDLEDYVDSHTVGKSAESKYLTHGIHPYRGKFFARMARALLNSFGLYSGFTVLDPFCGSGTTLLEACLLGIDSVGVDINSFSCLISRAKVEAIKLDPGDIEAAAKYFENIFIDERPKGQTSILDVLPERSHTRFQSIVEDVVKVVFSASMKRGEVRRPKDAKKAFRKKIADLISQIEVFQKLKEILPLPELGKIKVIEGDTRNLSHVLGDEKFDAIVTSPPYVTRIDYVEEHLESMLELGVADEQYAKKVQELSIGLEKKGIPSERCPSDLVKYVINVPNRLRTTIEHYIVDLLKCAEEIRKVLKEKSKIAIAIGKNHRFGNYVVPTAEIVREIFEKSGFKLIDSIEISCPGLSTFKRADWIETILIFTM
ncbi:MAG: DNA methyltransferase [Candidatus Baldrarchaeia archaeon]